MWSCHNRNKNCIHPHHVNSPCPTLPDHLCRNIDHSSSRHSKLHCPECLYPVEGDRHKYTPRQSLSTCFTCLVERQLGQQAPFDFNCTIHSREYECDRNGAILLEILRSIRGLRSDFNQHILQLQHDSRKRKREDVQHHLQRPRLPNPSFQIPDGSSAQFDPAPSNPRELETLPEHHPSPRATSSQLGTSSTRDHPQL
jgi:hypothetical protein